MKKDPFWDLKIKNGEEWQRIFNENFDPVAYAEAVAPIQEAINQSKAAFGLYRRLEKLEYAKKCECPDIEYGDDYTIVWCDVELDRSRMATDADYVAVGLRIHWYDEEKFGKIVDCRLYSTVFSKAYLADELCRFNPESFMIMDWFY